MMLASLVMLILAGLVVTYVGSRHATCLLSTCDVPHGKISWKATANDPKQDHMKQFK